MFVARCTGQMHAGKYEVLISVTGDGELLLIFILIRHYITTFHFDSHFDSHRVHKPQLFDLFPSWTKITIYCILSFHQNTTRCSFKR